MPKRTRHKDCAPPELFLDRGLGRRTVAGALREAGFVVHCMEDVFGDDPEWREDEKWIPEVTRRGWVIVLKDDKVRIKPRERDALLASGARVFCITRAQMKGTEMAEWLVRHQHRIIARAKKPGPYFYGVYEDRLVRLFPPDPDSRSGLD